MRAFERLVAREAWRMCDVNGRGCGGTVVVVVVVVCYPCAKAPVVLIWSAKDK